MNKTLTNIMFLFFFFIFGVAFGYYWHTQAINTHDYISNEILYREIIDLQLCSCSELKQTSDESIIQPNYYIKIESKNKNYTFITKRYETRRKAEYFKNILEKHVFSDIMFNVRVFETNKIETSKWYFLPMRKEN